MPRACAFATCRSFSNDCSDDWSRAPGAGRNRSCGRLFARMGFDKLARELGPTRNTLLAWAISNWPVLRRSSWPRTLAESASIADASIVVVNDEPHDTTRCCASESRTWHARKLIKLAEVTALNFVSMVVGVLTPYSAVKRAHNDLDVSPSINRSISRFAPDSQFAPLRLLSIALCFAPLHHLRPGRDRDVASRT